MPKPQKKNNGGSIHPDSSCSGLNTAWRFFPLWYVIVKKKYWLCYVLQFWLLQFICVHDKNEKTHVALAGVEQLAGADTAPKCSVIIGGLG